MLVAPLVGAWIEISLLFGITIGVVLSLLSWERGLKLWLHMNGHHMILVAPLVGAWIEILYNFRSVPRRVGQASQGWWKCRWSLSWERGLKFLLNISALPTTLSLLSWERGLKYSHHAGLV